MQPRLIEHLRASYGALFAALRSAPSVAQRASLPFIPQVGSKYGRGPRLLVVGKVASLSWEDFDTEGELARDDADIITRLQTSWRGLFEHGDQAPFWRGCAKAAKALGGSIDSIAWTNVLKVGGRGPPHTSSWNPDLGARNLQIRAGALNMLRDEIDVLQPDIVLFVTGPAFDHYLTSALPEWQFTEERAPQVLARATCVRPLALRTRHFQGMTREHLAHLSSELACHRARLA